jgi:hypothetical protein
MTRINGENGAALETWLKKATRHLSTASAAQVRTEIREHYQSAQEAAVSNGASADEADRLAVSALGDPKAANCQYRNVLLTSAEARMLRDADREARAVCSRPWLKRLLLAIPIAALFAAAILFFTGANAEARVLAAGGVGLSVVFAAPFLPIYTPSRGRIFRCMKWVVLVGAAVLAFGPDTLKYSWLLMSCLWPVAWIEWTRVSIRRKLPVAKWPRQLYL